MEIENLFRHDQSRDTRESIMRVYRFGIDFSRFARSPFIDERSASGIVRFTARFSSLRIYGV